MAFRFRTLALLALLTLLQGIAPLLHAHVGGQFARTGTHMHFMQAGEPDASAQGERQDAFHASEMPEIGLGHFIERRLLLSASADDPVLPPASTWPALTGYRPAFQRTIPLRWHPPYPAPALLPPATAPPAFSV